MILYALACSRSMKRAWSDYFEDISPTEYISHQLDAQYKDVEDNYLLSLCTFNGISDSAVKIERTSEEVHFYIQHSYFHGCTATENGGCLNINTAGHFVQERICCTQCNAQMNGIAFYIKCGTADSIKNYNVETSVVKCEGTGDSIFNEIEAKKIFDSINITASKASSYILRILGHDSEYKFLSIFSNTLTSADSILNEDGNGPYKITRSNIVSNTAADGYVVKSESAILTASKSSFLTNSCKKVFNILGASSIVDCYITAISSERDITTKNIKNGDFTNKLLQLNYQDCQNAFEYELPDDVECPTPIVDTCIPRDLIVPKFVIVIPTLS